MLIKIDRSKPFDPNALLSASGFAVKEEDLRSLTLTEIDTSKIQLRRMAISGERTLFNDERVDAAKRTGLIRLDGKVLEALLSRQAATMPGWRIALESSRPEAVFFDGTILTSLHDKRDYAIYTCPVGGIWEARFLGPWAGRALTALYDPS